MANVTSVVLRPEVLLRVPVPVQAAHPLRLQRAARRGARLRQVAARRAGRGARARAARARTIDAGGGARRWSSTHLQHAVRLPGAAREARGGGREGDRAATSSKNARTSRTSSSPRRRSRSASATACRVAGRIDLVRRIDTGEVTIVDLKSNDRAQAEDGHRDAAPHLRARLPGAHRPAAGLRRDLRAGRAEAEDALGG